MGHPPVVNPVPLAFYAVEVTFKHIEVSGPHFCILIVDTQQLSIILIKNSFNGTVIKLKFAILASLQPCCCCTFVDFIQDRLPKAILTVTAASWASNKGLIVQCITAD
jgi:hypothetical protein